MRAKRRKHYKLLVLVLIKLTNLAEFFARHGGKGPLSDTTFEIQNCPSLLEELTD